MLFWGECKSCRRRQVSKTWLVRQDEGLLLMKPSPREGPVEKVWARLNNDGPLPRQRKAVQEESGRPAPPMGQRNQSGRLTFYAEWSSV